VTFIPISNSLVSAWFRRLCSSLQ